MVGDWRVFAGRNAQEGKEQHVVVRNIQVHDLFIDLVWFDSD